MLDMEPGEGETSRLEVITGRRMSTVSWKWMALNCSTRALLLQQSEDPDAYVISRHLVPAQTANPHKTCS